MYVALDIEIECCYAYHRYYIGKLIILALAGYAFDVNIDNDEDSLKFI